MHEFLGEYNPCEGMEEESNEILVRNQESELCLFRRLDKLTRDTIFWMDCLEMKTQVNFIYEMPCIELGSGESMKKLKTSTNKGSLVLLSRYMAFYSEFNKYTVEDKMMKMIIVCENNIIKILTCDGKIYKFKFYLPGQSCEIGLLLSGLYDKDLENERRSYHLELEAIFPVFNADWISSGFDDLFEKIFHSLRLWMVPQVFPQGFLLWKEGTIQNNSRKYCHFHPEERKFDYF
eukprot:TRINITY_DN10153_c0_g1_i5.p1 TRINITY_DN10153_c0_g1~~TRINITY_DN10153_c0_g1_i5.p1  ORF type:complete len:234 (-),score=38.79 TRINITY_DN10153_c0_g1_i5:457-1158(-)